MKILVICQYYYPENFSITEICESLASKGFSVIVLTALPSYGKSNFYPGFENLYFEIRNGVQINRVFARPRGRGKLSIIRNYCSFWKNSRKFVRHFHEDCDLVYSMVLSPITAASAANLYARIHHVAHVHHCLDLWPESAVATGFIRKKSFLYWLLFALSKALYKKMNFILVSSPSFETYFREILRVKKTPIFYVPQPPLATSFSGDPIIYQRRFTFVYAGNIGSIQLVPNFVEACSYLVGDIDFSFEIFGAGSGMAYIQDLIIQRNLSDYVHLRGTVPSEEIPKCFANATALVLGLSCENEWVGGTIPNKLINYLACGKPIIGALKGDGADILKASGGGYLVSEDPKAIAKAMKEISLKDAKELLAIGEKNRSFFAQHFSTSTIIEKLSSVFVQNVCSK